MITIIDSDLGKDFFSKVVLGKSYNFLNSQVVDRDIYLSFSVVVSQRLTRQLTQFYQMSGDDDVVDNGEDSVETLFLDFLDPMYSHQIVIR